MAMMVNGLNFFSHTFSSQTAASFWGFFSYSFLAYFGDRLCRHSILRCTYRIYDHRNFQFLLCLSILYLFVCMSEIWWPDVWHTFNKWNAFLPQPFASPSSSNLDVSELKYRNNMLQSFFLSLENDCKLCNFKEIKKIFSLHMHIKLRLFHSSALLLTTAATATARVVYLMKSSSLK